jgi:transcriptional regulator with GAF, ATPase, and Fis domain
VEVRHKESGERDRRPEEWLAATLVELADTLLDEFDMVDFLSRLAQRCVELFGAVEAGLMLADPGGRLQYIASSSERAKILELFELQAEEGPCLDCFRTGEQVVNQRLVDPDGRWPRFSAKAAAAGFVSAHALPLRVRGNVIGAINLFHAEDRELDATDVLLGQAMADIATIGILQARTITQATVVADQLQDALKTRITLEQAKGRLAERAGVELDAAFAWLRGYSRHHNRGLTSVAAAFLSGDLTADDLKPRATPGSGTVRGDARSSTGI